MGYNLDTLFDRIWIRFHHPKFKKGDKIINRERGGHLLEITEEPMFVHTFFGRKWGYCFVYENEQHFVLEDIINSVQSK